jgi:hypothetical protein
MSKLDTAAQEIIVKLRTIETLGNVPDYPPEQIGNYPFVVVYPAPAEYQWNALASGGGDIKCLYELVVELHIARFNMAWDTQQALIYAESIPLLFFSMVIDGDFTDVDTFEKVTNDGLGELNWGATKTLGFRFRIKNVKIRTDIP